MRNWPGSDSFQNGLTVRVVQQLENQSMRAISVFFRVHSVSPLYASFGQIRAQDKDVI